MEVGILKNENEIYTYILTMNKTKSNLLKF